MIELDEGACDVLVFINQIRSMDAYRTRGFKNPRMGEVFYEAFLPSAHSRVRPVQLVATGQCP